MRLRLPGLLIAAALTAAQATLPAPTAPKAAATAPAPAAPKPPAAPAEPKTVPVPSSEVVAILGQPVAGPDGKSLGRLIDVLVNEDGRPSAAVIDFGGFMGLGSRKIAVRWDALHFAPGAKTSPITLDWTIDQIRAAPEYGNAAKPAPVVIAPITPPKPPAPKPSPQAAPASATTPSPSAAPAASPEPAAPASPATPGSSGTPGPR